MVETTSVREERSKLSARDRLCLIQTINALPPTQFDELVFALDPPKGVVSPNNAPQGQRSKDLLDWLEGSSGPGLVAADEVLQILIPKATKTAPQPLAFVISGKISSSTAAEVQAFVELLRKKTGDNSIDIAFFQEGSIKVILNGSPEGLAKLQEMFESGELARLDIPSVEAVVPVDTNTQDAHKARLIQALSLQDRSSVNLDLALDLARDLALALDRARNYDRDLTLDHALDIVRDIIRALIRTRDVNRDLYIIRTLDIPITRDIVRARALTNDLARDINITRDIIHDIIRALALALASNLNLSGADLSGANLRYINLRGVDLTGTDLTYADVTGTIFGDNPGLTEADKRDLQSRGAIIQDPPSSDVPSLVLR